MMSVYYRKRIRPFTRVWSVAFALVACSRTIRPGADQPHATAFIGAAVIDVVSGETRHNQNIIVVGTRMAAIGPEAQVKIPVGATVIDAQGKFIIPGLWDMHLHLLTSPEAAITLKRRATDVFFPQLLANGVTSIRDLGSSLDSIVSVRNRVRSGEILGPRIVMAGALLSGRNPYAPPSEHAWIILTTAQAKSAVDSLKRAGVDFIKAHDLLSDSVFFAIAANARRVGLPLVGHLRPQLSVDDVIDSGQVGIEHVPIEFIAACSVEGKPAANEFYGKWIKNGWTAFAGETIRLWKARDPQRCDALLAHMKDKSVAVTPTTVLRMDDRRAIQAIDTGELTPENRKDCMIAVGDWGALPDSLRESYYATVFDFVGTLHRAGITLLAGTDGPANCRLPGIALHRELENFVRSGLTPLEALQTATIKPARFLGLADSVGTVANGKVADLVLLSANPLADISNTRKIDGVMVRGQWLDRQRLDSLRSSAKQLTATR